MPLIRIETRDKSPSGASPEPAPQRPRPDRGQGDAHGRAGVGPAILAGALVGLLAIGAISVYVITQRRPNPATAPATSSAAVAPAGTAIPADGPPPLGDVAPLNADYPRQAIVAWVSGESYAMEELEIAVRVAKALSAVSGDEVPDYGTPAMRDFQMAMLRREVDGMLMRQALRRSGVAPPAVDVAPAIDGYLQQFGGTPEQLAAALAANGVTRAHLDNWFTQSRDTQFYIQTQLMVDRQPEEQEQVVRDWLAGQWETQDIRIDFYDPATPSGPSSAPAP